MFERRSFPSSGGTAEFAFTSRSDGDFALSVDPSELSARRLAVAPFEWSWLDQVHGSRVVTVREPGDHRGAEADGLVTAVAGAVLAIQTADSAPVLIGWTGPDGLGAVVGAAHGGWRGLYAGIVEETIAAMTALGAVASEMWWRLGPCISAPAYEFSASDLTRLALRFGPAVVAVSDDGSPALDLRAAVRSAMASGGVDAPMTVDPPCTARAVDPGGTPSYFSWRARAEHGRQTSAIWIMP